MKGVRAHIFVFVFCIVLIFATVFIASLCAHIYVYLKGGGFGFDFFEELARSGEVGVKIGGLIASINLLLVFLKRNGGRGK